ncbi:hypothetical protein B0H15DRAFT_805705 [Mycena belliarum]|uniref:Uncharacterized protein n=1 Tax=Mycena belliarum TaxID=1033014 RepID=A0AAD6XJV4_9AGAR|nr:hypothetical protein B0H15DRAFT_805705 [Mycena belliae]
MTRHIVESDDEGPRNSSAGHAGSDSGIEDIDQHKDPKKLLQIIRTMQPEKNSRALTARREFGDVTNTVQNTERRDKRKKDGHCRPHKRTRIEGQSPEGARSGSDDGSDESGIESSSQDDDSAATERDDAGSKIKRAGRLYVLQRGLWVKGNAHIFEEALDPKYNEKKSKFCPKAIKESFRGEEDLDCPSGVTSQRSNTGTRLRKIAGAAIFDCSPTDLLVSDVRLEKFREQIGWYVEEGASGAYSSLDVPILHKDWSGEYDIKTCFLNRCLMRLYVALIRGPTAAAAMAQADKQDMNSTIAVHVANSDNMEQIFRIDHTEPGAIAGVAVLAIWALSADNFLRDHGDRTNIDYETLFNDYLEILIVGLRDGNRSILNVFNEWDRAIFPMSESGHGKNPGGRKRDGNKKAMEALRAEKQAAAVADGIDHDGDGDGEGDGEDGG